MIEYRLPNHSSALKKHPEIAELVGVYISTFSMVEYQALNLFAALMRSDLWVAHTILHQFNSFSHRLAVTEELAAGLNQVGDTEIAAITALVQRVKKANTFRNRIAHSLYALEKDSDDLVLVAHATSKRDKPRAFKLTRDDLAAELSELEKLHEDIEPFAIRVQAGSPPSPDKGPRQGD